MQPIRRRPRSRSWLWFLIIVIIIGALWWFGVFGKVQNYVFQASDYSSSTNISQIGKKLSAPTGIKEKTGIIFNKIIELPSKITSDIVGALTDTAVETVKKGALDVFETTEEQLGLKPPAARQVNEEPLDVAMIGNKGKQELFLVEGKEGDSSYTILWGDGEETSGTIKQGERKSIPHTWKEAGSYLVTAEVVGIDNETRQFSIPVFIR